jgi:hypothetical protein
MRCNPKAHCTILAWHAKSRKIPRMPNINPHRTLFASFLFCNHHEHKRCHGMPNYLSSSFVLESECTHHEHAHRERHPLGYQLLVPTEILLINPVQMKCTAGTSAEPWIRV